MSEKAFLRNKHSLLSEWLPLKYLTIFPGVFEEVRTSKPLVPELHKAPLADEKVSAHIADQPDIKDGK